MSHLSVLVSRGFLCHELLQLLMLLQQSSIQPQSLVSLPFCLHEGTQIQIHSVRGHVTMSWDMCTAARATVMQLVLVWHGVCRHVVSATVLQGNFLVKAHFWPACVLNPELLTISVTCPQHWQSGRGAAQHDASTQAVEALGSARDLGKEYAHACIPDDTTTIPEQLDPVDP